MYKHNQYNHSDSVNKKKIAQGIQTIFITCVEVEDIGLPKFLKTDIM